MVWIHEVIPLRVKQTGSFTLLDAFTEITRAFGKFSMQNQKPRLLFYTHVAEE